MIGFLFCHGFSYTRLVFFFRAFHTLFKARCTPTCYKLARKRQKLSRILAFVGTVRYRRSLHGPQYRPSGTGLSSGIMSASLMAASAARAPGHLHPRVALVDVLFCVHSLICRANA